MIKRVTLSEDMINLILQLLSEEMEKNVVQSQKGEMTSGEYKRKHEMCQAAKKALEDGVVV